MSARINDFKIGLFILFGLVIFLGGLFAYGARGYLEPKVGFETYVTGDVEGLSVGSPVKYRGVQIGKVTRISFPWREYPGHHLDMGRGLVVVMFEVRTDVSPLPPGEDPETFLKQWIDQGLRVRIKGQGITGTSILSIEELDPTLHPAAFNVPWTPRSHYIPAAESQFSQMLTSVERSLRSLEKLNFQTIGRSLEKDLDALGTLLEELKVTNGKLGGFVDDAQKVVKDLNLQPTVHEANALVGDLRTLTRKLGPLVDQFDAAPIAETVANARRAAERLNDVLSDLRQYPSGFLFGDPPLPARSVDPQRK
jgi:phospholipid/cholesterol/gamma-HCH transport system substrate-binding protein